MKRKLSILVTVALVASGVAAHARAQEQTTGSCADCHNGKSDARLPGPPRELLEQSVHSGVECTDCHTTISMEGLDPAADRPHGEVLESVDCSGCHEEAAEVYVKHGLLQIGKDPDLPSCWNCHGTHDILPSSDRQSHVHPINLPSTCRSCHTDVDLVKKHEFLREAPIKLYASSVHGQASKKGLYAAATCNDCHSAADPD